MDDDIRIIKQRTYPTQQLYKVLWLGIPYGYRIFRSLSPWVTSGRRLTTPLAPMQGTQQDVPQGPSSNITLSRAELHEILDDALTRARTREVDNVRAIVDEVITARRDDIRGPPGRDGQDAPHSTAHWKTDDVGYFTPDPTSDVHVRTLRGTMYYTNVYAFINLLKALIPLKSEEVVRANLPSCLREAAARWYSAELSDEERQDLSVRSLELGWFATLERRFKPRATEAIVKVMAPSSVYSWRDVRAGRSVTEWAQNMLRDAQAAEITGTTTVLRLVWTRLEPALQRDIREPSPATTISQFMADLDLRYGQCPNQFVIKLMWNSIPNVQRQSQQRFPRNAYQPPSNVPQTQAQRTSYVPPQQQQPQGAYQPRQQQPQGQTNQAGQLVLSDKPWNQAGYSNTGYVARQPRARPAAAYQAEPQEVAPPDESLPAFYDGQHFYDPHTDAYYVDEEYNSYAEYPEEDPQAYWQAPPFQDNEDNEDDHDQPCYSVTEDLTPTTTYPKPDCTNGPVDLVHVATISRGQNKVACRSIMNNNPTAYALIYQTKAKKDLAYARLQDLDGFRERICDTANDFPCTAFPDNRPYDHTWQTVPEPSFDGQAFTYGRPFPNQDPPAQHAAKLKLIPWEDIYEILDSFGNPTARQRRRARREKEREENITQIDGAPDLVGPVISLLLAVEALWQYVGTSTNLTRITSLDHAGLIDFRARFVEGDPRVVRAMREGLGTSLNAVRDAIAFAEGLMLVDRCFETMKDETIEAEVGAIATLVRPPPQTPLSPHDQLAMDF
ncbi:reverse transcriptase [Penicillium digitatum]|uniref:Reverse transcriptase n=2 Tax=Penicillium digitatum TaxID=36651 RepID=A0A7T7BQI9_PENDI|nr:reverse transcriptase [Penicillium digitatum]